MLAIQVTSKEFFLINLPFLIPSSVKYLFDLQIYFLSVISVGVIQGYTPCS